MRSTWPSVEATKIINKHSNELERVGWGYMDPICLHGRSAGRYPYASSPATMTDEELDRIGPALARFDALSAREQSCVRKAGTVNLESMWNMYAIRRFC